MASCQEGINRDSINQLRLVDLPIDVLICIFKLCDARSLRNLSLTCKSLNDVISEDCVWIKHSNSSIITNQLSKEVLGRCFHKLSAKDRYRISINWRHGCYKEKVYNTSTKYMPWMHLESGVVWISRGKTILAVQRVKQGLKMHSPLKTICSPHTDDISRFVKTEDFIIAGGKDKYISGWSTISNKLVLFQPSNHSQDVQGLDCKRNILVSGSKDTTVKVWQLESCSDNEAVQCEAVSTRTLQVHDRVWCVALDQCLSCVAVGSAGYYGVHPLQIYDLDRGVERPLRRCVLKNGAAVFDIQWECPNTLITCGFDTVTRLWDLRVGRSVMHWSDPFGAAGYCLASDRSFAVVCGTAHHGRAQLWDKRQRASVQAFFGRSTASSPVYSLSFDPSQLFIAQDSCVNVFDFSPYFTPNTPHADFCSYWLDRNCCTK